MLRLVLPIFFILTSAIATGRSQEVTDVSEAAVDNWAADNWAEEFLAEDPLSGKEHVSLEDLREALADEVQRETALTRHFARLENTTTDQQRSFLVELLGHESSSVQQQAVEELAKLGLLEEVVVQTLLEFLDSDDASLRETAIVALSGMSLGLARPPDQYWNELIEGLNSSDVIVRDSARAQLASAGHQSVPILMGALRDERPAVQRAAALLLSEIVGSRQPTAKTQAGPERSLTLDRPYDPAAESQTKVPPALAKGPSDGNETHLVRQIEQTEPEEIRVYFGTNRQVVLKPASFWWLAGYLLICLSCVVGIFFAINSSRRMEHTGIARHTVLPLLLCVASVLAFLAFRDELHVQLRIGKGPQFGPRRDSEAKVRYGFCDVSIPPSHSIGELEAPMLGPEDENRHVILRRTQEVEDEAFFDLVRAEVSKRAIPDRRCFVFIHGFNVTFEDAARRTAQIHHDLNFPGVPIFFSWPSRASVYHYFSDRNEIQFSQYVIKQFLLDIADRVKADRIHVVAHSMGADATCRAISEMGDRGKIFDQIILAAPDIDRDVFRLQLVPRMAKTASRMTMYCSRSDLALHISYTFNDAPRAGDSSEGILVTPGIDTIDASGIDTNLLGHSYYGDCGPILNDVRQIVDEDLNPEQRLLKAWPFAEKLQYWTFPDVDEQRPPSNTENLDGDAESSKLQPDFAPSSDDSGRR